MVQTKCKTLISCFICEEEFYNGYTAFFIGKDGKTRFGSICATCFLESKGFVDKSGTLVHRWK